MARSSDYGMWGLVIINIVIFIVFAFSFTHPKTKRDWRSFGAFSAFIIALFTEMYGFPLTIYLFSGPLMKYFPGVDWLTHNNGHLLEALLRFKGDPHFNVLHLISGLLIGGGFILLIDSWKSLHRAQREHRIAADGLYARMRHPQYVGFVIIMIGFLVQWPTLLTVLMFPIMVFMYVRLARKEEQESLEEFGQEYKDYLEKVPAFIPRLTMPGQP